ncbi:MAG TPA: hypothetical protein DCR94_04180 [Firmicutes bacterium]|nr:hypothetical protein [Bacillota bacterium]
MKRASVEAKLIKSFDEASPFEPDFSKIDDSIDWGLSSKEMKAKNNKAFLKPVWKPIVIAVSLVILVAGTTWGAIAYLDKDKPVEGGIEHNFSIGSFKVSSFSQSNSSFAYKNGEAETTSEKKDGLLGTIKLFDKVDKLEGSISFSNCSLSEFEFNDFKLDAGNYYVGKATFNEITFASKILFFNESENDFFSIRIEDENYKSLVYFEKI